MINGAGNGWRWVESVVDDLKVLRRDRKLSQIDQKVLQIDQKVLQMDWKVLQIDWKCREEYKKSVVYTKNTTVDGMRDIIYLWETHFPLWATQISP